MKQIKSTTEQLHKEAVLKVKEDLEKSGAKVTLLKCLNCGNKKLFNGNSCEDCWYAIELKRIGKLRELDCQHQFWKDRSPETCLNCGKTEIELFKLKILSNCTDKGLNGRKGK